MIEKITEINISCTDLINQTSFNTIQEINTIPYQLTGFLVMVGIILLLFIILGCFKVAKKSDKICFQSWIYWGALAIVLLSLLFAFFWFMYPVIFFWI